MWGIAVLLLAALLSGCGGVNSNDRPNGGNNNPGASVPRGPVELIREVVAEGLWIPWEIAWTPDGRMLFTENPGRLRVVENGNLLPTPAFDVSTPASGVVIISPGGEAGMMGLAVDRDFRNNGRLYTMYCYGRDPDIRCKIVRLVMSGNTAHEEKTLLDFAGGRHHNAGRIKLGPDGFLYIAIGDFLVDPVVAQRMDTVGGKVIRITTEGEPAPGNPFPENPYVWAKGFRDPQGIAFDARGNLYGTDHGDKSNDEVNLITAGGNYGWPYCTGTCTDPNFVAPVRLWNPETVAPSGSAFYTSNVIPQWTGSFFFASLGLPGNDYARHVHRLKFNGSGSREVVEDEVLYKGEYGRIRTVAVGPDGFVYFSTSNGDYSDKIIRVRPR